jgi:hypothetical protein
MKYPSKQIAKAILMVRPDDFGFNEQTAVDNEFQHRPGLDQDTLKSRALSEFAQAVAKLEANGIEVLTFVRGGNRKDILPDAVFPNNWFATDGDGTITVFPMATPNRRAETGQLPEVEALLKSKGYQVFGMTRIGEAGEDRYFLEGTGSLVPDRVNRILYAARSVRTNALLVEMYARQRGYDKVVLFATQSSNGLEFYHTNVVMSIGEKFAVICLESIPDKAERDMVRDSLSQYREVIDISLEQAEKFFCANILQMANRAGEPVTVMSTSAWQGFTPTQQDALSAFGAVCALPIETIEYVGGGSARCMMAEIFLPKEG